MHVYFDRARARQPQPSEVGVAAHLTGTVLSVVVASALSGFRGVPDFFLRKLAVALDMDFAAMDKEKRPRTLEERLEMLIRKAVPDITNEQVVVAL